MKKIFLLSAVFLLGLFFSLPVRGEGISPSQGLSLLAFESRIEEVSGTVQSSFLIENSSDTPWQGGLPLPILSTGALPGSLSVQAGSSALLIEERVLLCQIPAGDCLQVSYQYQSAAPLIHARILLQDLTDGFFSLFPCIEEFSLSLSLRENDIPLVKEIFPLSWDFSDNTIRISFSGIIPGPLLSSVYVEKESYRDLKSGREGETELTAVEQFLLSHCSSWFAEGLSLPEQPQDIYTIFNHMLGKKNTPGARDREDWWSDYQNLVNSNPAFLRLVHYLILREYLRGNLHSPEILDCFYSLPNSLDPISSNLLCRFQTGEAPCRLVVGYDMDKALEDIPVYYYSTDYFQTIEIDGVTYPVSNTSLKTAFPRSLLRTRPDSMICGEMFGFRVQELNPYLSFSPEELENYLYAVEADLYVQQRFIDARQDQLPQYTDEQGNPQLFAAFFTLVQEAPISVEVFREIISAKCGDIPNVYSAWHMDANPEDPLSRLSLPCLIHYIGGVVLQEDPLHSLEGILPFFRTLREFSYLSQNYGMSLYRDLLREESLALWRLQNQSERRARQEALREKARAVSDAGSMKRVPSLSPQFPPHFPMRLRLWEEERLHSFPESMAAPCAAVLKYSVFESLTSLPLGEENHRR
ncbi:MAG: hypothetical protein J6H18_01490 [Lachnospiraceae bacterium]|nr:hypothetical protein [Lachnospiraceae bacterium]